MKKTLAGILFGVAAIGTAACSPTEPGLLPCDSSLTASLETFNDQELPTVIYSLEMLADTIRITGDNFHRRYTQIIRWPDIGVYVLLGYESGGEVIRNGSEIELLTEYDINEQGNKHSPPTANHIMRGICQRDKIIIEQEPLFIGNKKVYDGTGIFEYKIVK